MALPTRRVDVDLTPISHVLSHPLVCYPNTPAEFQISPMHRGASDKEREVGHALFEESGMLVRIDRLLILQRTGMSGAL